MPSSTDLEKNQWTVVSFDGVEAGGLTYDQATRLMDVLGDNGINGLCIITDVAGTKDRLIKNSITTFPKLSFEARYLYAAPAGQRGMCGRPRA